MKLLMIITLMLTQLTASSFQCVTEYRINKITDEISYLNELEIVQIQLSDNSVAQLQVGPYDFTFELIFKGEKINIYENILTGFTLMMPQVNFSGLQLDSVIRVYIDNHIFVVNNCKNMIK